MLKYRTTSKIGVIASHLLKPQVHMWQSNDVSPIMSRAFVSQLSISCHFYWKENFVHTYSCMNLPTKGLNPGLPHCRQILYRLRQQGSPNFLRDNINLWWGGWGAGRAIRTIVVEWTDQEENKLSSFPGWWKYSISWCIMGYIQVYAAVKILNCNLGSTFHFKLFLN